MLDIHLAQLFLIGLGFFFLFRYYKLIEQGSKTDLKKKLIFIFNINIINKLHISFICFIFVQEDNLECKRSYCSFIRNPN